MRLLLLLASAAAISKAPKKPTTGRAAALSKAPKAPTTGRAAAKTVTEKPLALSGGGAKKQVSYAWAVLHNWLYFLSLGLCIPVLPKVIASTVNDDGAAVITSKSARVAGDVEGVDKLLTFLLVGALGACSDGVGRKPLIALSALGYATTVLVQARATKVAHFFAADAIDGLTSCMNAVCVCVKSNLRRVLDATPARWRGGAGSSPLDGAGTATSSPRNDLVKNCRVHPTHWLISTQVTGVRVVSVLPDDRHTRLDDDGHGI